VFFARAPDPVAVLAAPEVLPERAAVPNAVLASPELLERRALTPTAVSSLPLAPLPAPGPAKKHNEQAACTVPPALNTPTRTAVRAKPTCFDQSALCAMVPILPVELA
jgi:hypothetical protein